MAVGTVDYYDFYELPRKIIIDEAALKKQFYRNTRDFHPDTYDGDAELAMQLTSRNNEAYKVMSDRDRRIEHLLRLEGEWNDKMTLPQEFLMEMMEINEQIMELSVDYDNDAKVNEAREQILRFDEKLEDELESLVRAYDENPTPDTTKALKETLLKKRYLRRLEQNITQTSPEI